MNTARLFARAWRILPRVPLKLVYAVSNLAADAVWCLNLGSVKQLRSNYRKLRGGPVTEKQVRDGVRSYFRCFAQQFTLPGWSPDLLRSSCVYPQAGQTAQMLANGPVVLALTHSGNWDLAGAWFCQNWGGILTVAEKVEPPELFEEFVDFRNSLGMEIIGVGKGEHVFNRLVEDARGRPLLVPLLADRDISGRGVEVTLGASQALVAAGPAALALALDRPLIAGFISYRRIDGNWTIHAHFTDPIPRPTPKDGETEVEAWTRAWVRELSPVMQDHLVDWHMMQKVFVDDLDPDRLARARARAKSEENA